METAEKSLNDMVSAADYDTTRYPCSSQLLILSRPLTSFSCSFLLLLNSLILLTLLRRYFVEEEANRKEREGDGTILKVSVYVNVPITVTVSSCRLVLTVRRRSSFTCRSSASTS